MTHQNIPPWPSQARNWDDIARLIPYGAHRDRGGNITVHCPHCDKKSLSIHPDKRVYLCHYCGLKGNARITKRTWRPPPHTTSTQSSRSARETIRLLWHGSTPLTGTDLVSRYLVQRDVLRPDGPFPKVLRYHPTLAYFDGSRRDSTYPGMLATVQRPDNTVVALHRTYLTPDGQKAPVASPKKCTPTIWTGAMSGAAVRLAPAGPVLGIAEGIETALSVMTHVGMPCWACVSAAGLAAVVIPPEVQEVRIWADHDMAGLKALHQLTARLLPEDITVYHHIPPSPGTDWADREEG